MSGLRPVGDGVWAVSFEGVAHLRSLAERAARQADNEFAEQFGMRPGTEREDLIQEGITWLLEYPGRAWVRASDGSFETPEDQLVADLVEHLHRTF